MVGETNALRVHAQAGVEGDQHGIGGVPIQRFVDRRVVSPCALCCGMRGPVATDGCLCCAESKTALRPINNGHMDSVDGNGVHGFPRDAVSPLGRLVYYKFGHTSTGTPRREF